MYDITDYKLWFDDVTTVFFRNQNIIAFLNLTLKDDTSKYYSRGDVPVLVQLIGKSRKNHCTFTQCEEQKIIDKSGRIFYTFDIETLGLMDTEFCIRAQLLENASIESYSNSFFIVDYMLFLNVNYVSPHQPSEIDPVRCKNTGQICHLVYNENTGHKHLRISVQLKNADGKVVTGRVVPLKVSLRYCNGETVEPSIENPTLLELMPDYPRVESDGACTIKARIMQISRNHGNRHFILRIEPDLARNIDNCDIGYAECGPFDVRTKLSDKTRKTKVRQCIKCLNSQNSSTLKRVRSLTESSEDVSAGRVPLPSHKNITAVELLSQLDAWVDHFCDTLRWKRVGNVTVLNELGEQVETTEPLYRPTYPNDFINAHRYEYYRNGGLREKLQDVINDISVSFLRFCHS